jgi:hypothetical protein
MNKLNNIRTVSLDRKFFFNNEFERLFSSRLKQLNSYSERLKPRYDVMSNLERLNILDIFLVSIEEDNFQIKFRSKSKIRRLLYCLDEYITNDSEESYEKIQYLFKYILKNDFWHNKFILALHRVTFEYYGTITKSYLLWKKIYLIKAKSIGSTSRFVNIASLHEFIEPLEFSKALIGYINNDAKTALALMLQKVLLNASYLFTNHFLLVLSEIVFQNRNNAQIDFLIVLLEKYENLPNSVIQITISALVTISKDLNNYKKDRIRSLANKFMGDPSIKCNWEVDSKLNERDADFLREAHGIMKIWVNEHFMEFFFDYSVNNDARKRFWKNLASDISELKINGTRDIKTRLEQNEGIKQLLESNPSRFVLTTDSNTAVIMKIKNRFFIEYSEHGRASYCFLDTNAHFKRIYSKSLFNPSDFINGNMPFLFNRSYTSAYNLEPEGRVSHSGDGLWMHAYASWFRRMLGINIQVKL